MKMNTKKLVLNALLLAIGLVLHQIEPAIFGVKPDMTLIMLFTILVINKDDYKTCLVCGIVAGIFAGMTSSFPGGQVPNLIDKFITTNIAFLMMHGMYKIPFMKKLEEKKQNFIVSSALMTIGTAISGTIFLTSASILVGLPGGASISMLFLAVVIPAIVINFVVGAFVYKLVNTTMKRVSFQS